MMNDIDPKRLYKAWEVVNLLNVGKSTLENWRYNPKNRKPPLGPVFVKEGKFIRYLGIDLINYIKKHKSNNKDGK